MSLAAPPTRFMTLLMERVAQAQTRYVARLPIEVPHVCLQDRCTLCRQNPTQHPGGGGKPSEEGRDLVVFLATWLVGGVGTETAIGPVSENEDLCD